MLHQPPKKERREYYRRLLQAFSGPNFQTWNARLGPSLVSLAKKEIAKGSYVAVYRAKAKEADLSALFSLPYKFCFPLVLSDDGKMEFRYVKNAAAAEEFHVGAYGILEPCERHPLIAREDIAASFVPLLAFDETGRRLGNGKGFYDRFLDGFRGLKIGVGFEWQASVTPLPDEAHDQRLDLVLTECELRDFRAGSRDERADRSTSRSRNPKPERRNRT